ncbi:type II toxin-antitoxin system HicB family antitoxin [Candidatus Thiosymbion oneisti]|uniref:type II toxin-antitoxin system HicB family antitoxin n=1 Tax=Candidatus Thiosymbion oneisti TaxID=589554 RepID=UPI001C407791|nr:type II toxin-antitoxin system HicB family antitoxin [Candidatus Thiosymbion oneisti]
MEIDGYKATIEYDPEIEMYRGEFVRLNGGSDFYAADIEGLRREGAASLRVFLEACQKRGIEPRKPYSGKFNVRMPTEMHAGIAEPPLSYEPESGESTIDSKVRSH